MTRIDTVGALESSVRSAIASATISDIHTHLFPPSHGNLLLWGVDELLTYHYLVAELFTLAPRELSYERFWAYIIPAENLIFELNLVSRCM